MDKHPAFNQHLSATCQRRHRRPSHVEVPIAVILSEKVVAVLRKMSRLNSAASEHWARQHRSSTTDNLSYVHRQTILA